MKFDYEKMTDKELEEHEQYLLTQWTPRMAFEVQISRLSSRRAELLEIYNKLKDPSSSQNEKLVNSINSLKYKIEDLEDELDDLIQDQASNNS